MGSTVPILLFDDAGRGRHLRLCGAESVVVANTPVEALNALGVLAELRAQGRFVGGYFSYELGYLLEPRLANCLPQDRSGPLLWFAAFDRMEEVQLPEPASGRAYVGALQHEWEESAYRTRFDEIRRYIAAGDIYQANLSFRAHFTFAGNTYALYRDLLLRSGAAHCAYLDDGTRQILSLSPELFFELSATGELVTRPMKGTIARGQDADSDAVARINLAGSTKDRAENLMIVDLLRNDLGRVVQTGSVSVENLFEIETYPTLHAMVSTVKGQLVPDTGIEKIIRALFPCGSITGAPKIRAMEILRNLETSPRGAYCGAIGYFGPDGSARFNVAIRTITIKDGKGTLGIGGGVVQDSVAQTEYAECLLKARYFENARQPIGLIETLKFEPGLGFARIDRHLARMENSAQIFGLPFDLQAVRAALNGAVAGVDGVQRVRLTLDEAGLFVVTVTPLLPGAATWRYRISDHRVQSDDLLLRHKTTWRDLYDTEWAQGGVDEVLFLNERDELAEGSRTNIFICRGGRLLTPPISAGILDGVLRRELLDSGACEEAILTVADLEGEVFLGNSLRGLMPARLDAGRQCAE